MDKPTKPYILPARKWVLAKGYGWTSHEWNREELKEVTEEMDGIFLKIQSDGSMIITPPANLKLDIKPATYYSLIKHIKNCRCSTCQEKE